MAKYIYLTVIVSNSQKSQKFGICHRNKTFLLRMKICYFPACLFVALGNYSNDLARGNRTHLVTWLRPHGLVG